MSIRCACLLPLLLLTAIGVSGIMRDPRAMDALEARVAEVERQYVEQLLSAYWEGVAVAGTQNTLVSMWRARLLHATEPVALATVADPDGIAAAARASGARAPQLDIEMVIAVWDRISLESKALVRPTGHVFLNVPPPSEALVPSGIDPSAIKDEALRAEYVRAIEENWAKATQLRKAGALDRSVQIYSVKTRSFLRNRMHGMSAQDRDSLENMLRDATHINPDDVAKILGEP